MTRHLANRTEHNVIHTVNINHKAVSIYIICYLQSPHTSCNACFNVADLLKIEE